ncbi:uncharacterized protein LOC119454526 isoform X2 [Dermacentor silvarum]|uniref:uncharacterized protein LOC119454526 isoform X2 n=1 Tax=Dermacentor silvarum TaxID=543639 RepID=UPI002100DEEF|nr:uncharacterized protein LOC119454526 isoform X2 [Dermacentor silvarum]
MGVDGGRMRPTRSGPRRPSESVVPVRTPSTASGTTQGVDVATVLRNVSPGRGVAAPYGRQGGGAESTESGCSARSQTEPRGESPRSRSCTEAPRNGSRRSSPRSRRHTATPRSGSRNCESTRSGEETRVQAGGSRGCASAGSCCQAPQASSARRRACFKRDFLDNSFGHSCNVCDRLCNADPAVPRTPQCVVPVCHSRSAPSSILYPLPAKPTQRQAWIDFVRGCPCGAARDWNPPTNEISLVCSLHFTIRCFRFEQLRGCSMGWRKRLRRGAVPTLYPVEERCTLVANENSTADTASILNKMEATVQVTRMQCGGWFALQHLSSSSPRTSPPSVAWKWPQRLPAVLSELCPSQCSAVGEWCSYLERL